MIQQGPLRLLFSFLGPKDSFRCWTGAMLLPFAMAGEGFGCRDEWVMGRKARGPQVAGGNKLQVADIHPA